MTQEEHNAIVERFFIALQDLKATRKLRGVKTFCDRYGIHRRTLRRIQVEHTHELRVAWLTVMVRDYGISASWLLTGEGEMYD